jgi:hypothetical protein
MRNANGIVRFAQGDGERPAGKLGEEWKVEILRAKGALRMTGRFV